MVKEYTKKNTKKWRQEKPYEWESQKCEKMRFFLFTFHLFSFLIFFCHVSNALEFAKCSSLFSPFLVENAANTKEIHQKNKEKFEK